MNNVEILRNHIRYNEEYNSVKNDYEILKNALMDLHGFYNFNAYNANLLLEHYRLLNKYYVSFREIILNNYHYDFIRNDNPMGFLDKITEYMIEIEELLTLVFDINTEGECML